MRAWRVGLRLALSFALALCIAPPVLAQGVVQQSGPVVRFHVPAWYANGVIGDGGNTSTPYLSAVGLFDGAQCPFSISSQTGPGANTRPHSLFSICETDTTSTLIFAGVNGQSAPAVFFNIGGVNYAFPGPGNGSVVGPSTTVRTTPVCWNSTTGTIIGVCYVGAVSGLPACSSTNEGARAAVTDASFPSYLAPVFGGGSTHAGVGCDGTNWVAGY